MIKTKNFAQLKREKLPNDIFNILIQNPNIVLAGGSVRLFFGCSLYSDYDLFFINLDTNQRKNLKDSIENQLINLGYTKIFQCKEDELRTYQKNDIKIQLIDLKNTNYISAEQIINSFDINACRFAFDGEFIYFDFHAVRDLYYKHISIYKLTYPVATIKRIAKYKEKGFKITKAAINFVDILESMVKDGQIIDGTVYID